MLNLLSDFKISSASRNPSPFSWLWVTTTKWREREHSHEDAGMLLSIPWWQKEVSSPPSFAKWEVLGTKESTWIAYVFWSLGEKDLYRKETVSSKTWDQREREVSYLFIWLHCVACGILVPQPGIEPRAMAVKALTPNHWTTREFPERSFNGSSSFLQCALFPGTKHGIHRGNWPEATWRILCPRRPSGGVKWTRRGRW